MVNKINSDFIFLIRASINKPNIAPIEMHFITSIKPIHISTPLVTKQSKLNLYRTGIRSIATYVSETWVLKETIIQKLLVLERKFLRRIFGPTKKPNMESQNQ
jgi:hypothetical protein